MFRQGRDPEFMGRLNWFQIGANLEQHSRQHHTRRGTLLPRQRALTPTPIVQCGGYEGCARGLPLWGRTSLSLDRAQDALLIALDRKVSRAVECNRGIRLSADELSALVSIGFVESLSQAKASILKEQVQLRGSKVVSISAVSSGSTMSEGLTESRRVQGGTSGGMTRMQGDSSERARARIMFDSRATG